MEYAPFGDLRYYITKGQRLSAPFPEEAIWRIFLQLCRLATYISINSCMLPADSVQHHGWIFVLIMPPIPLLQGSLRATCQPHYTS